MDNIVTRLESNCYSKDEFWKKLLDLDVSDCLYPYDYHEKQIHDFSVMISEIMPEFLYRYRTINDYTMQNLANDDIYGTSISFMNDNLEACSYFSAEEIKNILDDIPNEVLPIVRNLDLEGEHKGALQKFGGIMRYANLEKVNDIKTEIRMTVEKCKIVLDLIKENQNTYIQSINETYNHSHIACFSESYESDYMSSIYGDNSRGIVLQYKTSDLASECNDKNCKDRFCCNNLHYSKLLIPINYSNRKYNISTILAAFIYQYCHNEFHYDDSFELAFHCDMLYKIKVICSKGLSWQQEKEWRLIDCNDLRSPDNKCNYTLIHKARPTAILLLSRISKEDKESVIKIAFDKKIPVYMLKENLASDKYDSYIIERII